MIKPAAKRNFFFITCLCFFGSFCGAFQIVVNMNVRHPYAALLMQGSTSCPVISRQLDSISIYSTPTDDTDGARYSYVEGSTYDNRLAEIEAMGGDPSFFYDDEETNVQMDEKRSPVSPQNVFVTEFQDQGRKSSATNGMGPTPSQTNVAVEQKESDWEWDGTIDEDAHLGLD